MIVHHKRKQVILTPPHTASGNLHRALCTPELGWQWVIGPNRDGVVDHHYMQIPDGWGWDGYEVAVVVRNPFDRLRGLFLHAEFAAHRHGDPIPDWTSFCASIFEQECWFYRCSITELLGPQRYDDLIRFESLDTGLERFVGRPVKLSPPHRPQEEIAEVYELPAYSLTTARFWARPDCVRYGYDIEVPK
jgi:hypothetical protein